MTRPAAAIGVLFATLLLPAAASAAETWSLEQEFRVSPNQENPNRDSTGRPDVWRFQESESLTRPANPNNYSFVGFTYVTNAEGVAGWEQWQKPATPPVRAVGKNTGATTSSGTISWPTGKIRILPASSRFAIVSWRSPINGVVSVGGSVTDFDSTGDGINWFIDKGATNLASGSIGNGGNQSFSAGSGGSALANISVNADELIHVLVGPGGSGPSGNATGDSTGLELTVSEIPPPPGCTTERKLDLVTVFADCIKEIPGSPGEYSAVGNTRFDNGTRILTEGTSEPAPLVIDTNSHQIKMEPLNGQARQGALFAGSRRVARGPLSIATEAHIDPRTGQKDLAQILGNPTVDGLELSVSGFPVGFLQDLWWMPANRRGGVLMNVRLSPGFAIVSPGSQLTVGVRFTTYAEVSLHARADGRQTIAGGAINITDPLHIPGTPFELGELQLVYDGSQEVWRGYGSFGGRTIVETGTAGFGGAAFEGGAGFVIKQAKLDQLRLFYSSGRSLCPSCDYEPVYGIEPEPIPITHNPDGTIQVGDTLCWFGTPDPQPAGSIPCPEAIGDDEIRDMEPELKDPAIGPVLTLNYAEVAGENLSNLNYSPESNGPLGTQATFCYPSCPPPPKFTGVVVLGALGNRIIGTGTFEYLLSGETTIKGNIATAPNGKAVAVASALGLVEGEHRTLNQLQAAVNSMARGMDLAEATVKFKPPHRLTIEGFYTMPTAPFIRSPFFIGIDPPHFTGEAGVELRVPDNSPVLAGKVLGGAYGLVSDKAAAGKVVVEVCVRNPINGKRYCVGTGFSGAFVWDTQQFKFFVNLNDYRTVSASSAAGAARVPRTLRVPRRWKMAAFRVKSRRKLPNVQLTSPAVRGRRMRITTKNARRPGNRSGGQVFLNRRRHEALFIVPNPPAGRWRVRRRGGSRLTVAQVMTKGDDPDLRPRQRTFPNRTLSSSETLPLSYRIADAPPGTRVDLHVDTDGKGAGGVQIARGLPPSASTRWDISTTGLGTGRYHVYAVIKRDGIPIETRYWPDSVQVVDANAPPPPGDVTVNASEKGALVGWTPTNSAISYAVTARPVPASAGDVVEGAAPGTDNGIELSLPAGRRYEVAVQAVDPSFRRSAEVGGQQIAVRGAGNPPPAIAGEPNQFAEIGRQWAFAPVLSDLDGEPVGLRVIRGPRGMRSSGAMVSWTPRRRQVGYEGFVLEARDTAGNTTRRDFSVFASGPESSPPAPERGLAVMPAAVRSRRATTLTIRGHTLDRRTRVFAGRRRLRPVRAEDSNTLTVRVRCLRRGAYDISVRRRDGTREILRRGLTVTGRGCRRR